MASVLKTVGKVAGTIAPFLPPPFNLIAAGVALTATIAGTLLTKKPPVLGSATSITIGANQPTPYVVGRSYIGGARVAQEAYGTASDVPNAYALFADIYSAGGPVSAIHALYTDFNAITFSSGNASGYYHNYLYIDTQLGATPESTALVPNWSGPAHWGSSHKLSGYCAALWNARWPKDGKLYAAGFPQTGAIIDGVLDYDPRQDSTYPGGSGAHRWADPANKTAFSAAKATWDYGDGCPGRAALRYALGTWQRDESGSDEYFQTYGMGLPIDGLVVEDFVELMNVCDLNGWSSNGVLYEPGDTWANLKRITLAGGAEPVWKGALLGLKINSPKVSLDTIGMDDVAGEISSAGMQGWRDRPNTLIPMFRDADAKWEYSPSAPVQVLDYVTADGGERTETRQWDLVTDKDQAAQLTGYDLVNAREQPFSLTLKSEWRFAKAGEQYSLSAALAAALALSSTDAVMLSRRFDPSTMQITATFVTETSDKHAFALGLTGTSPPALTIVPPADIDGAINGDPAVIAAIIRGAYVRYALGDTPLTAEDAGGSATITVADQIWDYPNSDIDVSRTGGTVTGLSFATPYFVYFDDSTLLNATPTYAATDVHGDALNSSAHPFRHFLGSITTPADGSPPTDGGDDGGGGYCPDARSMFLRVEGVGNVAAGEIMPRMRVWGWDEATDSWGWHRVSRVSLKHEGCLSVNVGCAAYEVTPHHPFRIDGEWIEAHTLRSAVSVGTRLVARITVETAHSYLLLPSADAEEGVLSHNKTVVDPS